MQNPYSPPESEVLDPAAAEVALSGTGLYRLYRRLLIASTIGFLVNAVLVYLPIPWPEEVQNLRAYDGYGSMLERFHGPLFLIFLIAGLIARIGMFFLQLWARHLFVALYALAILLSLFWGVLVLTPLESAVGTAVLLMDGAIMVMALTRPLSDAFRTTEV